MRLRMKSLRWLFCRRVEEELQLAWVLEVVEWTLKTLDLSGCAFDLHTLLRIAKYEGDSVSFTAHTADLNLIFSMSYQAVGQRFVEIKSQSGTICMYRGLGLSRGEVEWIDANSILKMKRKLAEYHNRQERGATPFE